jgi:hypothetical protein
MGLGQDEHGRLLVADMDLHGLCRLMPHLGGYDWLDSTEGWSPVLPIRSGGRRRAQARPPRRFDGPHSVTAAPDGTLRVVTYYAPGLHIVPADGGAGQIAGGPGDRPALKGPATAHFDRTGRLLVAEYGLHGVLAYAPDGRFLAALGGGNNGFGPAWSFTPGGLPGQFDRLHMVRMMPDMQLVVADTWNHRLQRFSAAGEWTGLLGSGADHWRTAAVPTQASTAPGAFRAPVAVSTAVDGRLLVTDWGNNRLQWFDAHGRLLAVEDALGLDRPYDAQVYGDVLVVANSHKGQVLIGRP